MGDNGDRRDEENELSQLLLKVVQDFFWNIEGMGPAK